MSEYRQITMLDTEKDIDFVEWFNARYKVVGGTIDELGNVRVYRVDMYGGAKGNEGATPKGGKKQALTEFSIKSRKELVNFVQTTKDVFLSMLTLTYPLEYPNSGKDVKDGLNRILTLIRRHRENVKYLWWLEFQSRGAPHIHILLSFIPNKSEITRVMDSWTSRASFYAYCKLDGTRAITSCKNEAIKFNSHKKFWCRLRKADGGKRYATKYALKARQKVVPEQFGDVGRFWGNSRNCIKAENVRWVDFTGEEIARICKERGIDFVGNCKIIPRNIYGVYKQDGD